MKKVLSIVLSIAMVLCMMPAMAFAGTTSAAQADAAYSDTEGLACEGAVNVLSALGVVSGYTDGTYKPENTVTRAEMAKLIVTALGVADFSAATQSQFVDMGAATWAIPYVEYAANLGIIKGYGYGLFGPNDNVTYEQALTMVVRSLGYTSDLKEMTGTYPAVFVQKARELGLLDDVNGYSIGTGANRGDIAQILYNALDVNQVYANADGETCWRTGSNTDMLTNLNKNGSQGYGILSDSDADSALYDIRSYVGAAGKIVKNKNGEVIALGDVKTQFLTGDWDYDDQEFTSGGTVYKLNSTNIYKGYISSASDKITDIASSSVPSFTNGVAVASGTNALTTSVGGTDKNVTLACTVDGKTVTGVYSVSKWSATYFKMATSADKTTIDKNNKILSYKFATDKNGEIDYSSFILEGVSSLDEIAADNVLEIYVPAGSSQITKLCVGTKTVEGQLTKVVNGTATTKTKLTINGDAYPCYANGSGIVVSSDSDSVSVGDTVKAYLTSGNKVYKIEQNSSASNYGVVIEADTDTGSFGKTTFLLRLVTADGSKTDFSIESDFADDHGAKTTSASKNYFSASSWDANEDDTNVDPVSGTIVKYGVNAKGEIDDLELLSDLTATDKISKNGTFNGIKLSSNAVVFTFNGTVTACDAVKKNYGVAELESVLDCDSILARYYAKDNQIVAIIIPETTVSDNQTYGVVTSVASVDDDDYKYELTMLVDGVEKTYLYKVASAPAKNCVYKLKFDAKGNIDSLTEASVTTPRSSKLGETVGTAAGIEIKNNAVTVGGTPITMSSEVVVYKWTTKDGGYFEVGTTADIETADTTKTVMFYDNTATKTSPNKIADIVIVGPTGSVGV